MLEQVLEKELSATFTSAASGAKVELFTRRVMNALLAEDGSGGTLLRFGTKLVGKIPVAYGSVICGLFARLELVKLALVTLTKQRNQSLPTYEGSFPEAKRRAQRKKPKSREEMETELASRVRAAGSGDGFKEILERVERESWTKIRPVLHSAHRYHPGVRLGH